MPDEALVVQSYCKYCSFASNDYMHAYYNEVYLFVRNTCAYAVLFGACIQGKIIIYDDVGDKTCRLSGTDTSFPAMLLPDSQTHE